MGLVRNVWNLALGTLVISRVSHVGNVIFAFFCCLYSCSGNLITNIYTSFLYNLILIYLSMPATEIIGNVNLLWVLHFGGCAIQLITVLPRIEGHG